MNFETAGRRFRRPAKYGKESLMARIRISSELRSALSTLEGARAEMGAAKAEISWDEWKKRGWRRIEEEKKKPKCPILETEVTRQREHWRKCLEEADYDISAAWEASAKTSRIRYLRMQVALRKRRAETRV